ncbi:MAG TPA: tRNA (adenosine(37)-N6)-threonylcarbamoyltransferase complex dimerization subunit type 1 TsaB [Candidatus Acidoferrum sp.]|nr:tRNA (adenosine(37)-N6)-threonylcarbamoyltransferase complex dimerization subunit type 1 TsaB [Candidatus Acidoferrum sp.]
MASGLILTIRTDKPEAEIGIFTKDGARLSYKTWEAHRELSTTLLAKIHSQLAEQGTTFRGLDGLVVFRGPGSFTGLRIGITVANTLAYSLGIKIVGAEGSNWQAQGIEQLKNGKNERLVLPVYGALPHITQPTR